MDGAEVMVTIYKGQPMSMTLPSHIVVQIAHTEPGVKGDTANNVTKAATISTGAEIQVPLFINEGDWIKVDTRSRAYTERVKAP
jgi:elongation factor P